MIEEGAVHAIVLNAGGSTDCINNGTSIMSSTRCFTDAIIVTKNISSGGGDSNTGLV